MESDDSPDVRTHVRNESKNSKLTSKPNSRTTSKGSDIESVMSYKSSDSRSDKYKKMAKKLTNDKNILKDKVRRLINDLDAKSKECQDEVEKVQEYYQSQLNEVISERDQATQETEKMRTIMIEEKDKTRKTFEDKLSKHKETLEKRYGTKDSHVVKRLEQTITTLQERLNQQIEEREHVKDTTEQYYHQREEQLRKNILDLEEEARKLRDTALKDQQHLQMITRLYNNEKEQIALQIRREKDEEIKQLLSDKNGAVSALQNIKESLEKRAREKDKERDDYVRKMSFDHERTIADYEKKLNETTSGFNKKILEIKTEFEGKMFEQNRNNKNELKNTITEYEKKIDITSSDLLRKYEGDIVSLKKEVEKLSENNQKLLSELETHKLSQESDSNKVVENTRKKYEHQMERMSAEFSVKLDAKEKELATLKLRDGKIIGELEDQMQVLKDQLSQTKENIKKIQDSSQNLSNQFITNLNRQKEASDKEIASREITIAQIERQLKKLGEESIDKFNFLERKLKNKEEDYDELSKKYENTKTSLEKAEKDCDLQKNEMIKQKDICDKSIERYKQISLEKETQEKRCSVLELQLKYTENEIIKAKNEVMRFSQNENILREEKSKICQNLDSLRIDLNNRKKDIDNLNYSYNSLKEEYEKYKENSANEIKSRLCLLQGEKDRVISDLKVALANHEQTIRTMDQNKERLVLTISNVTNERDKARQNIDSLVKETERLDKIIQENIRESSALKNNFLAVMKEIASKDHELNTLRHQVSTLESKNVQIVSLNSQVTSIQENYKHTLDRLTSDHKKDREELNNLRQRMSEAVIQLKDYNTIKGLLSKTQEDHKSYIYKLEEGYKKEITKLNNKLNDAEVATLKAEQRIEQLKLEFLKKIGEAKQLPPEDKKRLDDLEDENKSLTMSLVSTEKRLHDLQFEYAQTNATLKTRSDFLFQREEELRKEAERIRLEPPKLLDPMFKKARDDALAQLRHGKLEMVKLKEEIIDITQKLQVAESLVKELNREKNVIIQAQIELKETFVNNLNQQQAKHKEEIERRENRIKDLEVMITERKN